MESDDLHLGVAQLAGLFGDPTRAKMLTALMAGKALTATELAALADVTPPTASSHLTKLEQGQLIRVRKQGRHKYFQLRGQEVAQLMERMMHLSAGRSLPVNTGPTNPDLCRARVCYDHLAGELGVAFYDALVNKGYIEDRGEETVLTASGAEFFDGLGVSLEPGPSRRPLCRSCLDWSERRNHLAGRLGQWVLDDLLERGWASRDLDSRILRFSDRGLAKFRHRYGLK
ncbi:winged helix-turn-helix domain-containing protein [Ferrimonas sp. YFM]|uniref:ArsR/SmtB family transcription factor n=1 Tax=Ferrimonas sp. YFM TaxID=3028878 RepID=UPI002573E964|nr:winged helix-turn-helix domain-containing protein [Ferrimonas sp. YFM]BDY05529.1 transcriptional regulator [Ferrimonas sp. YFM]